MNNITLRQLRYFAALARVGHFGRAAETCAISQPALSVQIRELETELGAALFERDSRHVRLTGFGHDFRVRAQEILRSVDELGDLARAHQGQFSGQLRLGVIPTIGPYLLPRLFEALQARHAGMQIHVRETRTARLVDDLRDGRIDAAIVALPVSEPGLTETVLFSEPFVLVRPEADAGRPVPEPEALRGMRLLLLEEGHCFRDQALSFCSLGAASLREGLDASSLSTLVQMVGAGIGVTLLPQMALPVETRSAPVSVTRFPDPGPGRTVGMIWRKTTPLAQDLAGIADLVREVAVAGDR